MVLRDKRPHHCCRTDEWNKMVQVVSRIAVGGGKWIRVRPLMQPPHDVASAFSPKRISAINALEAAAAWEKVYCCRQGTF